MLTLSVAWRWIPWTNQRGHALKGDKLPLNGLRRGSQDRYSHVLTNDWRVYHVCQAQMMTYLWMNLKWWRYLWMNLEWWRYLWMNLEGWRYLWMNLACSTFRFITLFGLFDLVVVFLLLSFVFLSVPLDFMILTRMLPHFSISYQW